ncbi:cytochrome P450 [Russula decolorans]
MQLFFINAFDCLAISFLLFLLVKFRDNRRRRGLPYPPGPPSWPIIGNYLDIPIEKPWITYTDMSKKYGDVISLRVFSQVIVVLSSLSTVKDLLEMRGEYYSERPYRPMMEMAELEWPIFISGRTETWRKGRRVLEGSLRPGAIMSYREGIQEKTYELLAQLRESPNDFRAHVRLLQGKFIMSITFGYDLKKGDRMVEAPHQVIQLMGPFTVPGVALVNYLPFLRGIPSWVPYFSYKPLAQIVRELGARMKSEPIDFVKNALHNGTAVRSLAGEYLRELEKFDGSERQQQEEAVMLSMGSLYQGFLPTPTTKTVSSMSSLFLALVLFPHVQRRAQAELDVVVGRDRLPTFDDRPRLPYIEALCKELMRWNMVTPIGVPHSSTRDDAYKGFFIPKGSMVVANAWAILHDPETYPDPEEFKPERFLNEDGSAREDPTLSLAFGVGKRICPGRHLVNFTVFIVTCSVLSVFNVTKAKDKNGNEIPVKIGIADPRRILVHPDKFECSILPRDNVAEDLILANTLS